MGEEDESSEQYKKAKVQIDPNMISDHIVDQKFLKEKFLSRIEGIKRYRDQELGDGTTNEEEALHFN